jgi:hypothetical protein
MGKELLDIEPAGRGVSLAKREARQARIIAWIEKRERLLLCLAILIALSERAAWAMLRPRSGSGGEAHNVAIALASGRGFADAFRVGQGPTDHLMPTTPAFAGAVYSIFGINTPFSEFILWAVATGLVLTSYLLYYRAFGRGGAPRWARLVAFWFLCATPTYVQQESTDFRTWDGALSAFLCALFLDRLFLLLNSRKIRPADILTMAFLAAAAFFTKPPFGLGIYAASGLFCVLNLRGRPLITALLVAPTILALFLVPWGLRNQASMGEFLLMRDNAGLELAISQYDGALAPIDGRERRFQRLREVHPMGPAFHKLTAMGEPAYNRMLGRQTKEWMQAHPEEVGQIMFMHLRQIVTPPPWLFRLWGSGKLATLRAFCASVAGVLGILGLIAGVACRRREWIYLAVFLAAPLLAYLVFQPLPRYIYLFYAPFAFSATGLVLLGRSLRGRNSTAISGA